MRDITLCHPKLQLMAACLVEECNKQELKIGIGETLRTKEEQDALYAEGRKMPGKIMTKAMGNVYGSYHQWGTAFDIYRNDGKGPCFEEDGFFEKVGSIGISVGLEWGGTWKAGAENIHFQLPDWGSTTAGIQKLYKTPEEFMKTWFTEEQTGWIRICDKWCYKKKEKGYVSDQWEKINHHWYLFDRDGYMVTGWHRWNGSICDPSDGSGDWYFLDQTTGGRLEGACWHTKENGAQEIWEV